MSDDEDSSAAKKHKAMLMGKKAHGEGARKGCVVKCEESKWNKRHGSYRRNGYEESQAKSTDAGVEKKSHYNLDFRLPANSDRLDQKAKAQRTHTFGKVKVVVKKADPSQEKTCQSWFIGHKQNFKKNYLPYLHNYHHILPYTSLMTLTDKELVVVMESTYNLNAGPNLIILPQTTEHAYAMMLPAHPHGHVDYNLKTRQIINEIRNEIEEAAETHGITKDTVADFKKRLESWQGQQYTRLVQYGRDMAKLKQHADVNRCPVATQAG